MITKYLEQFRGTLFGVRRRRQGPTVGAAAAVDVLEDRRLLVAPQMIEGVTAEQTGPPSLGIMWDTDANAAQYEVRIEGTHFKFTEQTIVSTNQHEVIFGGQDFFGNTYDIAVRGISSEGEVGPWSDTIGAVFEGVPNDPEPPEFIDSYLDGPYYTRPHNFIFRGGLPEYDIWVNKDGVDGPYRQETVTSNGFALDSEFGGGVFKIWIRGRDTRLVDEYESAWIGPMTVAIGGEQTVMTGPTDPGSSQPTFTWTEGVPDVDYQLWVNAVDGPTKVILETDLTTNSFTVDSDLPDGAYEAFVRQTPTSSAALPWSEPFRFGVGADFAIPVAPTLDVSGENFILDLTWNDVDHADSYEIWLADVSRGRILGEAGLTETQFTTDELATGVRGTGFRAWVRAFSAAGTPGNWSDPVTLYMRTDGSF